MSVNGARKWLAFGTGAGIMVGPKDLTVTLVRVRPNGATVAGTCLIANYAERPAAEVGLEYSTFLRQYGAAHLAAAVMLPRSEVIVRQLTMPGVGDKDLEQAVRFQIDGLHPFSEDEAMYDYARMGDSPNVLIGIIRRETMDRYLSFFAEAGIKVQLLTFSASVVYSSLRLFGTEPAPGFLTLDEQHGELEAYGESEARPVFSATFDAPSEAMVDRAVALALSELRLDAATPPSVVAERLPLPKAAPEGFDLQLLAMPYATALAAACPRLFLGPNLLPQSLRVTSSRSMYIVPSILGGILLLSTIGLPLYGAYQDRQYLHALEAEMQRIEPAARKPMAIDREVTVSRQRAQLLDSFRQRTKNDLDALNELTHLLNPPGWLNALDLTRDRARLTGEVDSAAGLLSILDKSPLFEGSDFGVPIARGANGETFSINTRREGALP